MYIAYISSTNIKSLDDCYIYFTSYPRNRSNVKNVKSWFFVVNKICKFMSLLSFLK